jgi:hypothetical protein
MERLVVGKEGPRYVHIILPSIIVQRSAQRLQRGVGSAQQHCDCANPNSPGPTQPHGLPGPRSASGSSTLTLSVRFGGESGPAQHHQERGGRRWPKLLDELAHLSTSGAALVCNVGVTLRVLR